MMAVVITDWEPGMEKVALTRLLQTRAGLALAAAKQCTDRCLAGERVRVQVPTESDARSLIEALANIGVFARFEAVDEHRAVGDAVPGSTLA